MGKLRLRSLTLEANLRRLTRAIQEDDEAVMEQIVRLSRSRRLFAPLAFMVGAFAMLLDGLKLLITNWRLTLVQVLPAVWIWLAMYDLKARVLHDKTVPSRLIGVKKGGSRRDKFTASALSTALGATVCTPPYLLGRLGILMLGSKVLLIPGIVLLTFGFTLQAGATGAVRAIKMTAALTEGRRRSSQAK